MSSYKVIGWLDPGQTTGMALWAPGMGTAFETWQVAECHTDAGLKELYGMLGNWSAKCVPHTSKHEILLGLERFDYRHEERFRDKIDYTAPEVIGAVRGWKIGLPHVDIEIANAATGKGFWENDKLKRAGLYRAARPHAMDALRHLLRYLTFHYDDPIGVELLNLLKDHGAGISEDRT